MLQRYLHRFVEVVLPMAQTLGGPGLALISFLDSSFLTFPEVSDALIVVLTVAHPARWFYYGAMATAGSTLGCLALFFLARTGGEKVLSRFIGARFKQRGFDLFRRFGLFTVVVGSLMPPPMPFKPFVILAGATGVPVVTFTAVVAASRGLRYIGEAWLAYVYGAQAIDYLDKNMVRVSVGLAGALTVGAVAFLLWRRLRPGYNRGASA